MYLIECGEVVQRELTAAVIYILSVFFIDIYNVLCAICYNVDRVVNRWLSVNIPHAEF